MSGINTKQIKWPGSSSQFIKGNGSLDSSVYITNAVATLGSLTSANGSTIPASETLVGRATTDSLTNKRWVNRVLALSANSATPAINTDNYDVVHITAQSTALTNMSTNLTGSTHNDGDRLKISITGTTAIAITWGTGFESSTCLLPTTTITTARLDVLFEWNTESSVWRCMACA